MNEVCLDLSRLTVREREEYFQIKRQLSRIDASESMSEFAKQAWPTIEPNEPFVHGWHMDAIADHLSAVKAGQIRNLLITIPPRHTKSTQVSVMFPAWVWTDQPWAKFLFASHAHSLSERDSVKCRRLVESDWYRKEFGIRWKLRADQNTKLRFDNSEGGYRIATSVGGAVVGEGGDYIVVDDAHKPMEVYSDTMRDGVLKWWDVEFSTRANNPKTVRKIVIMQRLHENDLVGHLLEKGGWEHLCLPAEFDSARKRKATSIGWTDPRKDDGELLWPVRVGASELAELKRDLGDAASGQLDQDPAPAKGSVFQADWWRYWTKLPDQFDVVVQSWDLTFDKKKKSDWVVGGVWGKLGADKYLLHRVREKMGFIEQIEALIAMTEAYPQAIAKYIEQAANAAALIAVLQSKIPGLIPIVPLGSKEMRARACAPQVKSGNVYLPHPTIAPWVVNFVDEHAKFPKGANDDQVDMTSQALMQLHQTMTYNFSIGSVTGTSKWVK
jgi:predicted phage terminase large subunit-like protein